MFGTLHRTQQKSSGPSHHRRHRKSYLRQPTRLTLALLIVVSPLRPESPRTSEPTTAVPLREEHESESEQSLSLQASLMPSDRSTASPSQPTAVSQETENPPAEVPSPPSPPPTITQQVTNAPSQVASLPPLSLSTPESHKPDYGWLAAPLLRRIETLKQYPASARLNHLEGRVIVRIAIKEAGKYLSDNCQKLRPRSPRSSGIGHTSTSLAGRIVQTARNIPTDDTNSPQLSTWR